MVFGLAFRSRISSGYVKIRLDQAVARLQKDVFVDYGSVEVKLSEWGIPRPSIEVRGIRLSPRIPECADSQIYIESLSFPLTWNLLFSERKIISNLRLSQMEVRLTDLKQCYGKDKNVTTDSTVASISSTTDVSAAREIPVLFRASSAAELDEVKIDQMKILFKNNYDWPIYMQSVRLNFNYEKSKLQALQMRSQILALKESEKALFRVKADFSLEAKRVNDNVVVQSDLIGRLLDREYKLQAVTNYQTSEVEYKIDIQQGALKAIYNTFRTKLSLPEHLSTLLNGYTLTLQGEGKWDLATSQNRSLKIDQLKIQSINSFLEASPFVVESMQPFVVKNGLFRLEHFDLSHIAAFFLTENFPQIVKTGFRSYGFLTGELKVDEHKAQVNGVVNQSEISFINRNEMAIQMIDHFNFEMEYDFAKFHVSANLHHFVVNDQKVAGDMRLSRVGQSPLQYALNLQGFSFNSDVSKVFFKTSEASVFDIESQLKDNRVTTTVKTPQLKYGSLLLKEAWLNKTEYLKNQQTQMQFKAQKLTHQADWDYDPLNTEEVETVEGQEKFLYQIFVKLNAQEKIKDITRIEWQSLQAATGTLKAQMNYSAATIPMTIQMKKNDSGRYVLSFSKQQKTRNTFEYTTDKNWNSFQFIDTSP